MRTTITGIAAGTCLECGYVNADTDARSKKCTGCGARVALSHVRGEHSDRHPCDAACQYAIGPRCVCACGGENHRAGYIHEHLVPVWVRQRDTDRHAARIARTQSKAAAKRAKAAAGMAALLEEFPTLEGLSDPRYDDEYGFPADMRRALENGAMSERQVKAAIDMIERDERRERQQAEREAADTAARAAGVRVPTGRQKVTGTIVAIRDQLNYRGTGTSWRMVVKSDDGWTVMGTMPGELRTDADGFMSRTFQRDLIGQRVTFTATLDGPGDRDQLFGFYTRPRSVQLTD